MCANSKRKDYMANQSIFGLACAQQSKPIIVKHDEKNQMLMTSKRRRELEEVARIAADVITTLKNKPPDSLITLAVLFERLQVECHDTNSRILLG